VPTVHGIRGGGGDAVAIRAVIAKPAEMQTLFAQAIDRCGAPDIVVANAGVELMTDGAVPTRQPPWVSRLPRRRYADSVVVPFEGSIKSWSTRAGYDDAITSSSWRGARALAERIFTECQRAYGLSRPHATMTLSARGTIPGSISRNPSWRLM
jgi:NAD(P)-dependent dehydrogenase (short-subunit alcohol dehydrogenase family)